MAFEFNSERLFTSLRRFHQELWSNIPVVGGGRLALTLARPSFQLQQQLCANPDVWGPFRAPPSLSSSFLPGSSSAPSPAPSWPGVQGGSGTRAHGWGLCDGGFEREAAGCRPGRSERAVSGIGGQTGWRWGLSQGSKWSV